MNTIEMLIVAGLVVLGVSMYVRHRRENPPVDMDHKAPNVHNVQMEGTVGPATAASAPAKKTTKKKKATTKKKATKKKVSKK